MKTTTTKGTSLNTNFNLNNHFVNNNNKFKQYKYQLTNGINFPSPHSSSSSSSSPFSSFSSPLLHPSNINNNNNNKDNDYINNNIINNKGKRVIRIGGREVEVERGKGVEEEVFEKAMKSKLFSNWINEFNDPMKEERTKGFIWHSLSLSSVDLFSDRVAFSSPLPFPFI